MIYNTITKLHRIKRQIRKTRRKYTSRDTQIKKIPRKENFF